MQPQLNDIRANYLKFSDEKLIRIATEDAAALRPEALEILKEVLKSRGLLENISSGIEVQTAETSLEMLKEYADLIRMQPCPICESEKVKLNAATVLNVRSFIISYSTEEVVIACPDCLDKLSRDAMFKTGLLGWWSIPWGIIRTIQALIKNKKMLQQNRLPDANGLLLDYVSQRLGKIEANRNYPEQLQLMIKSVR